MMTPSASLLSTPVDLIDNPGSIARRANVLAQQLVRGFGYYGQPRNYSPRLSITFYKDNLGQILNWAVTAETALSGLITHANDVAVQDADLVSAINQANGIIAQLTQLRDTAQEKAIELQDVIAELESEVNTQQEKLTQAKERYAAAVAAYRSPCDLAQIISVVSAIVAVVGSAYTAGGSFLALSDQLASTGLPLYQNVQIRSDNGSVVYTNKLNPTYSKLVEAGGNIPDILGKYDTLRLALQNNGNSARVVVKQEDFDRLTDDFDQKIDAAPVDPSIKDEFKKQAHYFIDLVQARNKKILERDGWIIQIQDFDRNIEERLQEITHLQAVRAASANPALEDYARVLVRLQDGLRDSMRHLVWEEMRALAVWRLQPIEPSQPGSSIQTEEFRLIGRTAADLLVTHSQIAAQLLLNEGSLPSGAQPIVPDAKVSVPISQSAALRFGQTRQIVFTIGLDDFPTVFPNNMAAVVSTSVAVEVSGVATFSGMIRHSGRQLFRRTDGSKIEFSSPVQTLLIGPSNPPAFLPLSDSYEGMYLGASPFTDWILIAGSSVSSQDLEAVREIHLTFRGRARPIS